jgi:predicted O-linked N-acetylglucosamine transferase (SPINDLY family)
VLTANNQAGNLVIEQNMQQAIIQYQNGELELAELLCNRIIEENPMHFDALYLAGIIALQNEQTIMGINLISKAIEIKPTHAGALTSLGDALGDLQLYEEALASYEHALQIEPDFAEAYNNYGTTLECVHRHEDALDSYERALNIRPNFAEAHNNKGNALKGLYRLEEALSSYERALQLQPEYTDALNNHGNILIMLNRHEDAAKSFAQLIAIAPDFDYAIGSMLHAQLYCCNWTNYRESTDKIIQSIHKGKRSILPFSFLTISDSPADQLSCARIHISDRYPESDSLHVTHNYRHDKIRLAYLSADFREHAITYLATGLFEKHDQNHFETFAISFCPEDKSQAGQRVKSAFNQFIDASKMSDLEVVDVMRKLEIDIAVDLSGFTQGHRTTVFSHRPAPIQVNYLGYPGTMGTNYIDYILADRHVIPPEQQSHYTEKVIYLPDSYQVNDSRRIIAERTPSRKEALLPESGFIFCCFNSNYKISPEVYDIWMRLLHSVEGSVLWLIECNVAARLNLKREAVRRGIAVNRLIFAPQMKHSEHLARQRLADLFLDTLTYNAHTTASDALWAGLPVLTCTGNTFAGRVAGSLLHALGLTELICHTPKEYETLALKLATTPIMLNGVKAKLLQNINNHPLFNTDRFCRHIETAYITMWQRYQQGKVPKGFEVRAMQ